MYFRAALPLLATALLAAGPDLRLDLRTDLGGDPAAQIRLVPAGIWDGLLLASQPPPPQPSRLRGRAAGATVEVADFLPPGSRRTEAFARYKLDLYQRLALAFQNPPASDAAIDLGIFMATDPTHPEQMNQSMVRSLQDRFNRVPPSGSPVELK